MTTPKCMGLMLNAWMVGSSIGAMMMMAGTVSRKQPTISRNTLMTSNNTTGLSDRLAMKLVIIWGTCSKVMKVENTVEVPSRKEVTPLRTAADTKVLYRSFQVMSWYTNRDTMMEYTTETAAAQWE